MALCTAAFTSCKEKEEPEVKPDDVEVVPGEQESTGYCFEAVIDEDFSDAQTKTTLGSESNNQVPVLWNTTDKIVAIQGALYISEEAAFKDGDRERAVFNFDSYPSTTPAFFAYPAANVPTYSNNTSIAITIPSPQEAVAGSFADNTAPAVGTIVNNKIVFKNAGALLKVRFGQSFSRQPIKSITLSCSSGDFSGSRTVGSDATSTGTGTNSVTLTAPFGESLSYDTDYYFVVWPGAKSGLTITVTDIDDKTASWTNSHELNPSRNDILTIAAFDIPLSKWNYTNVGNSSEIVFERVWGKYGTESSSWPAHNSVSGLAGTNYVRNATLDDTYIYVPKCSAEATDTENFDEASIYMFNVSNGAYAGIVQRTTDPDYMAGNWASTFPVSCARVMKNTNASLNGGKDILVCTNLCNNQRVRIYAWENGINSQPRLLTNFTNGRRFGDIITVEGTYQEGRIWYRSYSGGMIAYVNLVPGYTSGFNGSHAWNWVEALGADNTNDGDSKMTSYTSFNNGSYGIVSSNSGTATYVLSSNSLSKKYTTYQKCFGWQAFQYKGESYIAYIDLSAGRDKPVLKVIKGAYNSLENLKATLDSPTTLLTAYLASENATSSTKVYGAANNVGDCQVRIIDGVPHILAITTGSMVLYKMYATTATGGTSGFPVETIDPGFEF